MKQTLAAVGLGALVCLPCLLVAGAAGFAAGGALLTFVREPVVQGAGLLVVVGAVLLGWRAARRTACETCVTDSTQPERAQDVSQGLARLPAATNHTEGGPDGGVELLLRIQGVTESPTTRS